MDCKYLIGYALAAGAVIIPAVAAIQAQPTQSPQQVQKRTIDKEQYHSEGERIFAQNCSRCHNAPEGFSPRITGTIVRHMRVRAQLSAHDEQELLRFFNP
jgi:cytochrome c5